MPGRAAPCAGAAAPAGWRLRAMPYDQTTRVLKIETELGADNAVLTEMETILKEPPGPPEPPEAPGHGGS